MNVFLVDGSYFLFIGWGCFSISLGKEEVLYDVWVVEIEVDGIIGMDFIWKYNCWLILGQGCYELVLNGYVIKCEGEEQMLMCVRVVVQVIMVIL